MGFCSFRATGSPAEGKVVCLPFPEPLTASRAAGASAAAVRTADTGNLAGGVAGAAAVIRVGFAGSAAADAGGTTRGRANCSSDAGGVFAGTLSGSDLPSDAGIHGA